MEHEMRLAVIPFGGDAHPMVMPYCVGCGWVGGRRYTFAVESVSADWRMHVKEFKLMQHARERALIEDVEGSK